MKGYMCVLFKMDKKLAEILQLIGLDDVKTKFLEHKVYTTMAARHVTDAQYEIMGVAIGQVAALRCALSEGSSTKESVREERIKSIVGKIRQNKSKDENKILKTSAKNKSKMSVSSEVSIRVGWLHQEPNKEYKQVRLSGAGIRIVSFQGEEMEKITPQAIVQKASRMFFPDGKSIKGAASDMDVCLGTYSHDVIDAFTNLDGIHCSYLKYLKEYGLFPSRVTFYIMTTTKVHEESDGEKEVKKSKKGSGELSDHALDNQGSLFNEITSLKIDEAPKFTLITNDTCLPGELSLEYEELRESSYSEVIMRSISTNIQQCYQLQCLIEPGLQDTPLTEYSPLEMGPFHVCRVSKGDQQFLNIVSEPSHDNQEVEVLQCIFPKSNDEDKLILHPPSQLWGYDGARLIVVVVASCHGKHNVQYIWYKDGEIHKEGSSLACICLDQPGTYNVEVQYGGNSEVSEPFEVQPVVPSSNKVTMPQPETPLPVIENSELTLGKEIGSGTFGTVYKASWAGTPVAVKVLKVRNAKRLSSTLENEVKVHSSVRHPNIVQVMGVSFRKNAIYIVSEFIDGNNLDDILFGDDGDESHDLNSDTKISISRHLCQAIAYLHNLKPQIVHRDIKPANVLVSRNHVTKLCDMGLAKFKSTQSLTTTMATSMPGTPQYMAPECLLYRKSATAASDIWSLGCTLVECFLGEDLWREEIDKQPEDDSQITALTTILTAGEPPNSLVKLKAVIPAAIQQVLVKCFEYAPADRPMARDVLAVMEH